MKLSIKKVRALDSCIKIAIRKLALAINTMDQGHILIAEITSLRLKVSLAKNIVRRKDYTSLGRKSIYKNKLADSYVIRYLLIKSCVKVLTGANGIKETGKTIAELNAAIENKKATYLEIQNIAETLAKSGKFQQILSVLLKLEKGFSLNQSDDILYFIFHERYNSSNNEHSRLIEDVIAKLDILNIKPKSPEHIYKQTQLIGSDYNCVSDIDLAILSDSDTWFVIEAKTGKKKNLSKMRRDVRRGLKKQVNYLRERFGILPEMFGAYRSNGDKEFNWFPVKLEA